MTAFQFAVLLFLATWLIALPVLRIYHWIACWQWRKRRAEYHAAVMLAEAKREVRRG